MTTESEYDVIIVGCGLVGAAMALALRKQSPDEDLRIAVVDRQAFDASSAVFNRDPQLFDARVSALTASSQQLLQDLEVWQGVEQLRYCPYQNMQVWDGEGTGSIEFDAAKLGERALGTIVENSVLLAALNARLNAENSIDKLIPFTIASIASAANGEIALASAEGAQLSCKLLIGADGANSRVREHFQFTTREWDYQHTAIVTTVKTELPHQATAWQRFTNAGPLAFLPLRHKENDEQRYCSIVWSTSPEKAEELMSLSDDEFRQALESGFEHRLGKIEWTDKRYQLPLRQRHATRYYQGAVALIGDAAHTIHPLAGQGVNLGLLDAAVLAQELGRGTAAGRSIDDPQLLARYQRKRKGHNLGMMWMMEGFKYLFAQQAPPVNWLRNAGLDVVDNFGVIKNQLARRAMGLD